MFMMIEVFDNIICIFPKKVFKLILRFLYTNPVILLIQMYPKNLLSICFFFASACWPCPVVARGGCSLMVVHGLLTLVASLLQSTGFSSCGAWAQLPSGMWGPPRAQIEPVSPALAGRFSTIGPPGSPQIYF